MKEILQTTPDERFPFNSYVLKKMENGKKAIGFLAHEQIPFELIRASGLIALPLFFTGTEDDSSEGGIFLTHSSCTFARNVLGAIVTKTKQNYNQISYFLRTNYCNGDFCGLEYASKQMNIPMINFFIPLKSDNKAIDYFHHQILQLKKKLEDLTGKNIQKESIQFQAEIHNKLRSMLRNLNRMGIKGTELLKRYQESTIIEPNDMIKRLEFLYGDREFDEKQNNDNEIPRILFSGDSIFIDDFLGKWLEDIGVNLVAFDSWIGNGLFESEFSPQQEPDLCLGLAEYYINHQGQERCISSSIDKKVSKLKKLVKKFDIDGIINHGIKFCDYQALHRAQIRDELGKVVPVLDIERDYSRANLGPLRTRVEAFLEIVTEGK